MKAKTIKAFDGLIAALEEMKDALEAEANKSGDSSDDGDTAPVSGRGAKAKTGGVPAKGKKSRPVPDDDDDVDGDADADADDETEGSDDDDDDAELPPPKSAAKGKGKPAAKPAPAAAAKGKAKAGGVTIDTVKEKLTAVMNEESLGKARVLKILKKYGAAKSAELEAADYAGVCKACDAAMAEVEATDDDV